LTVTTFIIGVTSSCNLECGYCFARSGFKNTKMTNETLKSVIHEIDSLGLKSVRFLWHGGEPLLLGLKGFEYALEIQRSASTNFLNTIQTNATLIDNDFADFFATNKFSIGVSVDGYEDVQNANRPMSYNRPSFDRVIRGIKLLQDRDLKFSCISVISDKTDSEKYFEFISNLGVRSFAIKPSTSTWEHSIDLISYTVFYQEVMKRWLDLDDPNLIFRNFMGYAENLLSGKNMKPLCSQSGFCGHFAFITPNGDVFPCDQLDDPKYRWGNINDTSLQKIIDSKKRQDFLEAVERRNKECEESCVAFSACQGGCSFCHEFYTESKYCDHLRAIVESVRESVACVLED